MQNYTIVDLTHVVHPDIPTWDLTCGYYIKTMRDYRHCDGKVKFRSQALDIRASAGTHMDSPAHCFEGSKDISDLPVEQFVAPCVVIDVSDRAHEHYKVSAADVEAFEKTHGTIPAGSFVLFYTGWSRFWPEPKKYHNNHVFPSVSREVAQILLERNVVGLGIDTLAPDCDEHDHAVHEILLGNNKYIIENVAYSKGQLPPLGATILALPLRVKGAAESPVRLIALVPKK